MGRQKKDYSDIYAKMRYAHIKHFKSNTHIPHVPPGVREKIIDMAMNGSGVRDTGRVLGISKDTVTSVLKKRRKRRICKL